MNTPSSDCARRITHRLAVATTGVVATALLLAGCASPTAKFDDATATALHARVVAVAERSSAADYAGAVAELARLEGSLDAAVAAGDVPADRETGIRDAIALVRADLDALIAAAATPTPTPAPADDKGGKGDKGEDKGGKDDGGKGKGKGGDD
ncbi:hypothetical protein ACDF64_03690 [Agromyces sp. MMS24-JH15]|uniref:hypothetical protein n=1 Tax=Agromyces sp. MMS24-JH15 TaxID=3243765 RepID=UPI003747D943